jgi:hypothetical protein
VGVEQGSRKCGVDMGFASLEVILTQRMVQVNVDEVTLSTILPELLKAKELMVPNLVAVAGNGSEVHSLKVPSNELMMELVVVKYVVSLKKGLNEGLTEEGSRASVRVLLKSVEAVQ